MSNSFFAKQVTNKNYLSPVGFKFNIVKTPKVDFFSNSAKIPGITLPTPEIGNYLKKIELPGDNIQFEDLTLDFIVDENLENYLEVHNWIYGLGYPESIDEFQELITMPDGSRDVKQQFSDGTLSILNSNFNVSTRVKFRDLFPISLSSLEFTATENDYTYFTATATFKYLFYTIEVDN
tara:strand:+ start:213 stop:749 length:537 start_codon:yes stop_codon:yes gene_type:complete